MKNSDASAFSTNQLKIGKWPGLDGILFRIEKRLKVKFSKKATNIEVLTVDSAGCSKCQIEDEDFDSFCGLLTAYGL